MNLQTASAVAGAGAGTLGLGLIDALSISLFNVKGSTIFMALLGAAFSHAFSSGEEQRKASKKRMYFEVIGNMLAAATIVGFVPHAMGWEWYSPKLEGSMAFLVAVVSRVAFPLIFKTMPEILRKWFKLGEYNQNKGD